MEPFIQRGGGIQNKHYMEKAEFNDSSVIMEADIPATVAQCKPYTVLIS